MPMGSEQDFWHYRRAGRGLMLGPMEVLSFLIFSVLLGVGAMLFGVDSRDDRRPSERIGALLPLR